MLELPLVYKFFLAERNIADMVGIYKFTNRVTGKSYIGKSADIQRRYNNHKSRNNPNTNTFENSYFHREMAKYGFEAYDFEVLEECEPDELNEKEIFYIKKFKTLYPDGYNIEAGGIHSPHSLKITWDDVYRIQQDLKDGDLYCSEIAKKYGLSTTEISMINKGQIWVVEDEQYPLRNPKPLPKKAAPVCKICGAQITLYSNGKLCRECWKEETRRFIPEKEVLVDLLRKYKQVEIGKMYGVSRETVRAWRRRYGVDRKGNDMV